ALEEAGIEFGKPILVGKFVDKEAPEYVETLYSALGVRR
ncbi:MAG: 2-oxoacid:ferredoxin oxidoreductase subunit beta, partial [Crenarchaeota archaeon]|nr:2-oxoacid:ferredoxin oxidoreductase subunit beta [Thermoproteota archaeon]